MPFTGNNPFNLPPPPPSTAGHSARQRGERLGRKPRASKGQSVADRWRQGATGEQATAMLLEPLTALGWQVLHDLTIPGSAANIDHLVITPTVVWLIDSKHYQGRVTRSPGGELRYGRTRLADQLRATHWATGRLTQLLHHELALTGTTVMAALCIHGPRLPQPSQLVDGLLLTEPRALLHCLTTTEPTPPPPGAAAHETITTLANACHRKLRGK